MSATLAFVLSVSLAAIAGELLYRIATKDREARLVPRVITLLAAGAILFLLRPSQVDKMGSIAETASMIICYAAMVLGMAAEYGYSIAERRTRGETSSFDMLTFLMPIFASPIVFIPLLTLTSELGAGGGAFTRARLMVYLVAFQNGFFWKQLFEQRRQSVTSVAHGQPAQVA
jgi:hypothetical protein